MSLSYAIYIKKKNYTGVNNGIHAWKQSDKV